VNPDILGTLIDEVRGMKQAIERSSASGASLSQGATSTADADDVEEGMTWGDEDLDSAGGEVGESGDDDEVELLVPGEATERGDGDGGSSEEDVDSDEDEEDLELAARGQPSHSMEITLYQGGIAMGYGYLTTSIPPLLCLCIVWWIF
jgi:hypothetical protein